MGAVDVAAVAVAAGAAVARCAEVGERAAGRVVAVVAGEEEVGEAAADSVRCWVAGLESSY